MDIVGKNDELHPSPMQEIQVMIERGLEALKPRNAGFLQVQPLQPNLFTGLKFVQHLQQTAPGMKHKFSSATNLNNNSNITGGGHDGRCCRCGWESSYSKGKDSPINEWNAGNGQNENDDGFEDGAAGGAIGNVNSVDDEHLVFSIEIWTDSLLLMSFTQLF